MGGVGLQYGIFLGLLVTQTYLPGFISGEVVDETWTKRLLRVILGVSVTKLWTTMIQMVGETDITDPYVLMVFKELIPAMIMGVTFFLVADLLSL